MGFIQSAWDSLRGKTAANRAAESAMEASGVQAGAHQEALGYLREREALPMQIRDEALTGLQGYHQPPEQMDQGAMIEQARQSPLYQAIMGQRQAGEDALLRTASATGGLRSGGAVAGLTDYSQQLENQALLESYNQQRQERELQLQGLRGLAGIPTNEMGVAGLMSGIGQTQAQGITAAAQARQMGAQGTTDLLMGIGNMAVAGGMFSDIRLKQDIQHIGKKGKYNWYRWNWSEGAKVVGMEGSSEGVLAHDVWETNPEAIGIRDGFLTVDYEKLDLEEAA